MKRKERKTDEKFTRKRNNFSSTSDNNNNFVNISRSNAKYSDSGKMDYFKEQNMQEKNIKMLRKRKVKT